MAKAMKKEPLVVGQRIWLEELSWYHSRDDVRTASEFEIVKTNQTSAYAVRAENMESYKNGTGVSMVRINQRTREAKNSVSRFNVWPTKEAFKHSIQNQQERAELRQQAQKKVSGMSLRQLRQFMEVE